LKISPVSTGDFYFNPLIMNVFCMQAGFRQKTSRGKKTEMIDGAIAYFLAISYPVPGFDFASCRIFFHVL
jgi:hypothetical protein